MAKAFYKVDGRRMAVAGRMTVQERIAMRAGEIGFRCDDTFLQNIKPCEGLKVEPGG